MKCRLCNEEKPLVDAHIIPRSIYEEVKDSRDSHLVVVQNKDGTYPKKSRIGFYDSTILCSDCDGRLGKYDEYGKQLIFSLNTTSEPVRTKDGRLVALKVSDYDYPRLKLFFLSILWRASISQLEQFARVRLGPYESLLRDLIRANDPGTYSDFPVLISRFTDFDLRLTMMDPVFVRMDGGIRHWLLYLVACNPYIKVDRRMASPGMMNIVLAPDRPMYVVLRNFKSSKESGVFDAIAKRIRNS